MNESLVNKYLEFNNLRIHSGAVGPVDLFYPFLLMDVQYGLYQKYVAPVECRQSLKQYKKRWRDAYTRFNKRFFAPYTVDEKDAIIDMMDEYTEFINNSVTVTRVAVMNELSKHEAGFEDQQILSACVVCNILAQCANIVYEDMHRNVWHEKKSNLDILTVKLCADYFCDCYINSHNLPIHIDLNKTGPVDDAVDSLLMRLLHFPKFKKQKEVKDA